MYLSSVSSRLLLHDTSSWDLKISNGCYDGIMRDLTWSDDSKYILQVNSAGLVEVLSPTDCEVRSLQHIPLKDTWSASFHREGHRNIAVGTKSGCVKIWDTKNKTIFKSFPTPSHPSCVSILSYNARNTSLAATMSNGDTIIYGLVSNIPVLTFKLTCSKSISAMKFHHELRSLIGLATEEGHIILRDITTNKDNAFFENIHALPVSDFSFSLVNKDVMLSSGYDKMMQVYDIRLQNIASTVKTSHILTSIAINTDNLVALGSKNGDVLIYDLRDLCGPIKILKAHNEQVSKVAFQPPRKKFLTDVSLKEEVETVFLQKNKTPEAGRSSDIFFMNDTPPSQNVQLSNSGADNAADMSSFLVMVGLDQSRKKFLTDISLKEEVETVLLQKNKTPETSISSDIFFMNDTPPSQNVQLSNSGADNAADMSSFLVKVGLDQSNLDDNLNLDLERNSEELEIRVNTERNMSKVSTPINKSAGENPDLSPVFHNSTQNDNKVLNAYLTGIKSSNDIQPANNIDSKVVDEIKDFISDVSHDHINYFLHITMALTKQKIFLEKQFSKLNQGINKLEENQNSLLEATRMLTLQMEQLKMQQNNAFNYNNK